MPHQIEDAANKGTLVEMVQTVVRMNAELRHALRLLWYQRRCNIDPPPEGCQAALAIQKADPALWRDGRPIGRTDG